jgi:hypothetical protein
VCDRIANSARLILLVVLRWMGAPMATDTQLSFQSDVPGRYRAGAQGKDSHRP